MDHRSLASGEKVSANGYRARPPKTLGSIANEIDSAFDAGDRERITQLLDRDPLGSWYALPPDRFAQILEWLADGGTHSSVFLRLMDRMLTADAVVEFDADELAASIASSSIPVESAVLIGRMFNLRLQGHPCQAMRVADGLLAQSWSLQPMFDSHHGAGLFSAVQVGLTAMLAGDFPLALAQFTRARMHVLVPHLAFLTRDAMVLTALIEALFGNPEHARELLADADRLPRTASWAEAYVEVGVTITEALVSVSTSAQGLRLLEAVPLHQVGELWPFYLAALRRLLRAVGEPDEARRRVAMFATLPLPRTEGEGFTGSVVPLAEAWDALDAGDVTRARERVGRADASLAVTRVTAARIELAGGRPREALRLLDRLHEQTGGLRVLEVGRLSVLAACHLALGATDDCREVLQQVLRMPGGLGAHEARSFTGEVHRFAHDHVTGWPFDDTRVASLPTLEPLTAREVDLLRELASPRSREEIAQAQFISVNTLKAHLRSVFRKLGVSTRTAAVLEGERRGIL